MELGPFSDTNFWSVFRHQILVRFPTPIFGPFSDLNFWSVFRHQILVRFLNRGVRVGASSFPNQAE